MPPQNHDRYTTRRNLITRRRKVTLAANNHSRQRHRANNAAINHERRFINRSAVRYRRRRCAYRGNRRHATDTAEKSRAAVQSSMHERRYASTDAACSVAGHAHEALVICASTRCSNITPATPLRIDRWRHTRAPRRRASVARPPFTLSQRRRVGIRIQPGDMAPAQNVAEQAPRQQCAQYAEHARKNPDEWRSAVFSAAPCASTIYTALVYIQSPPVHRGSPQQITVKRVSIRTASTRSMRVCCRDRTRSFI